MKLLHTCAEESSVHGLPHLVAENRHWLERFIWAVIVVCSIYCSYAVCLTTWTRYQESPTVLTLQTDYRNWVYRPPAVTVCPEIVYENRLNGLIHKFWNIDEDHEKFNYYKKYVETIANATYNNLNTFETFIDDKDLTNIDMLEVAWNVGRLDALPSENFLPVITEMGVCFTSSNLSYLQNVSNMINYKNRTWPESCFSFDLCKSSVIVSALGAKVMHLYVHTEDEIMTAMDTISSVMRGKELVEVTLWVDETVASSNLKYLSPARRKCLYPHETSSYFKVHTPNLCKVDCRIRKAMQVCGCIPFFYNINSLKKCNASGMVCLSNKFDEWYFASCPCMDLCESTRFTQRSVKTMIFPQLNNQLSVEMFFPKRRIKRSVLFSLSDLIVSFGGAAALFLGCSFLSGVEFIYFFLEYAAAACWQAIEQFKN